jgi:hypothetical protein
MVKNYLIHDNGGRPFRVEVNPAEKMVNVFINYKFDEYEKLFNKKVFSSKYQKIWIGKSPKTEMTLFSNGYGSKFDGNSILIEKSNNTYVFIGKNIFSFKSVKPIIEFISPVANSDVPLPYAIDSAIDSEGNFYLMTENIMIKPTPITLKIMKMKVFEGNPYDFYYSTYKYLNGFALHKKYMNKYNSILTSFNIPTPDKKLLTEKQINKIFGYSPIPTYKELVKRL